VAAAEVAVDPQMDKQALLPGLEALAEHQDTDSEVMEVTEETLLLQARTLRATLMVETLEITQTQQALAVVVVEGLGYLFLTPATLQVVSESVVTAEQVLFKSTCDK
jgi:hypothetical protein